MLVDILTRKGAEAVLDHHMGHEYILIQVIDRILFGHAVRLPIMSCQDATLVCSSQDILGGDKYALTC